jgi:hypothetical protein
MYCEGSDVARYFATQSRGPPGAFVIPTVTVAPAATVIGAELLFTFTVGPPPGGDVGVGAGVLPGAVVGVGVAVAPGAGVIVGTGAPATVIVGLVASTVYVLFAMKRKWYVPGDAGMLNDNVADVSPGTGATFVPLR